MCVSPLADSWVVAIPKYDLDEEEHEDEDDPRGTPLAGLHGLIGSDPVLFIHLFFSNFSQLF